MGNRYLLDCTLRDGGYVNDWEFGHDNLISIFERLVDTKIDIIEVGFLDERRPFDVNRSIFPDTKSAGKIWETVLKRPPMVVGMIDFGTCGIEHLQPCEESFLDGIRVIFKKEKMHSAMEFCRQVKSLGYKVFSQLVSITAYDDESLMELISLVNDVEPYAVSIVDTYGLLDPNKLLHYYNILDENVNQGVQIGFHAHNNLQLAYANAMTFLTKPTQRDILVDGTLFGMGKSAGNAPLELLGMFMNNVWGMHYKLEPMMEAIEESIKQFYAKSPWGYKTFFYLCALNNCHPSYVEYFQSKGNLSVSKLNEVLSMIEPQEKKLLYDRELAESLYQSYVKDHSDDNTEIKKLKDSFDGRNLLLVGPGRNIDLQREKVHRYMANNNPVVISINYIPKNMNIDYVFITKANRYKEMTTQLHGKSEIKTIATSNLECKNGSFDIEISREPLLEQKEEIKDNSFLMFMKVLKQVGIKQIACAGFDGYSDSEDNYARPNMEYDFVKNIAKHLNQHIREVLYEDFQDISIEFITYSHYDTVENAESAAF